MTGAAIFGFLVPDAGSMQMWIGMAMLALALSSLFAARRYGNAGTWQPNWDQRFGDKPTLFEHDAVSVADASDAVAGRAERALEAMPGILLMIGLLGTFLGLGIALNDAASLLSVPQADSGSLAGTMQKLTQMMDGLGTKFKTSTWGILGFLLLKPLAGWLAPDVARVRWCADRIDGIHAAARQRASDDEAQRQEHLIGAFERSGHDIVSAIGRQGESLGAALVRPLETMVGTLAETVGTLRQVRDHARDQVALATTMERTVQRTHDVLDRFVDENNASIAALGAASDKMAGGAQRVAVSASELQGAIGSFESGVAEVLGGLKEDLARNIADMNGSFGQNLEAMSGRLGDATDKIAAATQALNRGIGETLTEVKGSMREAGDRQAMAIGEFNDVSTTLQHVVGGMKGEIDTIGQRIRNGLAALSKSNGMVAAFEHRIEAMTEEIRVSNGRLADTAGACAAVAGRLPDPAVAVRMAEALEGMIAGQRDAGHESRARIDTVIAHLDRMEGHLESVAVVDEAVIR